MDHDHTCYDHILVTICNVIHCQPYIQGDPHYMSHRLELLFGEACEITKQVIYGKESLLTAAAELLVQLVKYTQIITVG